MICPIIPKSTPCGFRATLANDWRFRSVPNRNIRAISMGITIQIVFISCFFESSGAKIGNGMEKRYAELDFSAEKRRFGQ